MTGGGDVTRGVGHGIMTAAGDTAIAHGQERGRETAIETVSGGAIAPAAANTGGETTALSPAGATQTTSPPSHGIAQGNAAVRAMTGVGRRTRLSAEGTEEATPIERCLAISKKKNLPRYALE